jgi:hypothetical protein
MACCGGRAPAAAAPFGDAIAGAIRWDAWYADTGPAREAQNALSYPPWQSRAPWFAKVDGPDHITAVGTQADMDLECKYAAGMGLKYWAFDMYAPDSVMSVGWHLYQASVNRHMVNWCAIVGPGFFGNDPFRRNDLWHAKDEVLRGWFAQPIYQTVLDGRPLVYVLWSEAAITSYFGGDERNFAASIAWLRGRCRAAGVGDPFVVIMAGRAANSARIMRAVGADAISNYIPAMGPPPVGAVPWSVLDERTQAFWASLAGQGVECIPIATTGWDTRARREHPESWTHERADPAPSGYFVLPTRVEVRAQIFEAKTLVTSSADAGRSRTIMIYSWDERDEGGDPLVPD